MKTKKTKRLVVSDDLMRPYFYRGDTVEFSPEPSRSPKPGKIYLVRVRPQRSVFMSRVWNDGADLIIEPIAVGQIIRAAATKVAIVGCAVRISFDPNTSSRYGGGAK